MQPAPGLAPHHSYNAETIGAIIGMMIIMMITTVVITMIMRS